MPNTATTQPLTRQEWDAFCADSNRQMETTRDGLWYDGELIDRSFLFFVKDGQLARASEEFGTTTGAPSRPMDDAAGALQSLIANAISFPKAIETGSIRYPAMEAHVTHWVMPHVICQEVNFITTTRHGDADPKPAVDAEPGRWERVRDAIMTGQPRYDGSEGGFQKSRFIQVNFVVTFHDGRLTELRELGAGGEPDRIYADPAPVWDDFVSGATNPLPNLMAGKYGPTAAVSWRILRHGTMGHAGLFIRPATKLGQ